FANQLGQTFLQVRELLLWIQYFILKDPFGSTRSGCGSEWSQADFKVRVHQEVDSGGLAVTGSNRIQRLQITRQTPNDPIFRLFEKIDEHGAAADGSFYNLTGIYLPIYLNRFPVLLKLRGPPSYSPDGFPCRSKSPTARCRCA